MLPNTKPPWGRIYSMFAVELVAMRSYIKAYLANGFIRPSQSHAAAPVMFVKRPDGKLCLVVDYRGLNAVTVKNRFPLPLIPEMLDRLHHTKVFTKIDLRNAYYQVRVKEGDEWKTTFKCREGHFEYQVLGPLPIVTSVPLVRVPIPLVCAYSSSSSCASSA